MIEVELGAYGYEAYSYLTWLVEDSFFDLYQLNEHGLANLSYQVKNEILLP